MHLDGMNRRVFLIAASKAFVALYSMASPMLKPIHRKVSALGGIFRKSARYILAMILKPADTIKRGIARLNYAMGQGSHRRNDIQRTK